MTRPWSAGEAPVSHGTPGGTVTLVEGSTFCISGPGGDIRPGRAQGLFVRDTRVLSRWELAVDGRTPQPLTVQQAEPYAAAFLGRMPPPAGLADSTLLVVRHRYVGDGMREDVIIRNTAPQPATCVLTLAAATDFADLFEVKDGRARPQAAVSASAEDSALRFASLGGNLSAGWSSAATGTPRSRTASSSGTWQSPPAASGRQA